jgi:nucleotide-binding universal stress UspA family protein
MEELQRFALPASKAGLNVKFSMREGSAVAEILEEARASTADLIVMGTHGRSGFERLVLGSVTEKVLRKAACPIMTVAPTAADASAHDPTDLRHIVCPLDFSEASKEALRYALSLAERSGARLTVLHVIEWPELWHPRVASAEYERFVEEEATRQLRDVVPKDARTWCRVEERVLAGSPWKRILGLAAEEAPDLVVLGAHGHNTLERFLFGSTANQVVRQAPCPVVSVRR